MSGLGAFAAVGSAVLCLAFSPKVSSATFTPKFAVVLLFAAVGIVPLARFVKARSPLRWPARALVAFLAVALVSALVSTSPNIGIFGLYSWGEGFLLWLGAAGAFAIGASLGPNDRRWLYAGLLVGALGNALVAISQIVGNFQTGGLALFDATQADGLLGNPIHLEALLLGALALILGRACRSPLRWGVAVLLLAVALEFTSERFALAVLVSLVLYALYSYGARRGGTFALLIGVGYAIAYRSGGSGLGARVTSVSSATPFGVRPRVWLAGARYVLHHPLLGVGPGQFRAAMDSTASLSLFQNVLAGRILTDGHDIFIEVGVTTGVLGLACFLIWLLGAARTAARCTFLGFAAAMAAVELVEPINVAVLPLSLLGLGAATAVCLRHGETAESTSGLPESEEATGTLSAGKGATAPYARVITLVAVAMALFLGVTMVLGDAYMFSGTNHGPGQPFNLAAAKDANRLLSYWPDSALEIAQIEAFDSITAGRAGAAALLESRHWTAVAVSRDSSNPRLWTLLAGADVELKAYGLGRTEYYRALSCDKWYTQALQGLGRLAGIQRNWKEAIHWYRSALATVVKDPLASGLFRALISGAERKARAGRD